jgi:hypothetical protein
LKQLYTTSMFRSAKTFFRYKQECLLLLSLLLFYGDFYITYFPKYMKYNMTQNTEHIPFNPILSKLFHKLFQERAVDSVCQFSTRL